MLGDGLPEAYGLFVGEVLSMLAVGSVGEVETQGINRVKGGRLREPELLREGGCVAEGEDGDGWGNAFQLRVL